MLFLGSNTVSSLSSHVRGTPCVLFVQAKCDGTICIEGTKNPSGRLRALSEDNSGETFLIGLLRVEDPTKAEEELHARFASAHVRGRWFQPVPALIAFIQTDGQAAIRDLLATLRPHSQPEGTITIEEMAAHLNVSVPTVRRMVKAGRVPYLRAGNQLRFLAADVVTTLQNS